VCCKMIRLKILPNGCRVLIGLLWLILVFHIPASAETSIDATPEELDIRLFRKPYIIREAIIDPAPVKEEDESGTANVTIVDPITGEKKIYQLQNGKWTQHTEPNIPKN
jgi:hypothetical protein